MSEDCAVVVMSCDSYSDLWNDFFELKNKYWAQCPYRTYLVTNNISANIENVITIHCGNQVNWTGRLMKCLNEIKEEKVILMLEDYYISSWVDNTLVNEALEIMQETGAAYYKLETRGTVFPKKYNGSKYLREVTAEIRYGVSLVTSIWDKDFLMQVIGNEDYPAWEFELRCNQSDSITRRTSKLLLCDTRNILHITHMVQRGKYLRGSIRKLKRQGDNLTKGVRKKNSIFFDKYLNFVSWLKKHTTLRLFILKMVQVLGFKTISEKYADEMKGGNYK